MPIFEQAHPNFNFHELVSTCRNIKQFHYFMLDIQLIENVCNLISQELRLSQEQDFSQIWDLCKNTVNSINFYYRPNREKLNDQIFQ